MSISNPPSSAIQLVLSLGVMSASRSKEVSVVLKFSPIATWNVVSQPFRSEVILTVYVPFGASERTLSFAVAVVVVVVPIPLNHSKE